MEQLLEIARKRADRVELMSTDGSSDNVSFENAKLKDIASTIQSGVCLTLVKDGKLGFAYTRNLIDRKQLVEDALAALKGEVAADYEMPLTRDLPRLDSYDPAIEKVSNTEMVKECQRVCDALSPKTEGQVNCSSARSTRRIRVMNSAGTDLSIRSSSYYFYAAIYFPGSYSSVYRMVVDKKLVPASDEYLDYILNTFTRAQKEVKPESGKVKVLFLPEAVYSLVWRLLAAASAKPVYEKVSPLKDKVGQQVFSDKLTIVDEPLNDQLPDARAFDDEGTRCRNRPIVENGVFKGFYADRYYAWKLGIEPTGNGYRGDITSRVNPTVEHLALRPGAESFASLLRLMGRGIMVGSVMGAHSGNILNGDFSIGLSPGFWVENGEVAGHVKDAMLAGNIYETLKNVVAVGSECHHGPMGYFPAVLLDGVSFATKG